MFNITLEQTFRGSCKTWAKGSGIKHGLKAVESNMGLRQWNKTWAKGSGIKHGLKAVIPCTLNHLGPFASTKYSLLQCFSLKHVTM